MFLSLPRRAPLAAILFLGIAGTFAPGQYGFERLQSPLRAAQPDAKEELLPPPVRVPDKAPAKNAFTVTLSGEVDAKLAPVVGQLTAEFYECYPRLVERFDNPKKPAPRNIKIVFDRNMKVPAYCTGAEIHVSIEWLNKHPEDIGVITHELTHSVQGYRGVPGWLTEGLADYARQIYGPKEQKGWSLPKKLTEKQNYTNSYRVTARFLVWLDEKHPGVIDKIHRRCQDREFDVADFRMLTGSSIDMLWAECVKELGSKKAKAPEKT
jgi:hypothetical protein